MAGTLSAVVDGRRIRVGSGEMARFPVGSVHRWWNEEDDTLAFEGFVKPVVDFDLYIQAVFEVLNSGAAERPPLFYMAHVFWRHRRTQAIHLAPLWIQAVLFPAIVFVGTVLGRYRGTNWPGCPDRCTEAPLISDGDV